ncbi:MAG: F0F1 ATP synthase subunit A [Candidatus Velthaea sp.]
MHEGIGEHPTWQWPLLGSVHSDTILTTWVAMALAIGFFWWLGKSYTSHRLNKVQATFEAIINFLSDLALGTLGPKGERFVPLFVGIFLFIWILNEFGVLFLKAFNLPFGGSPTADLNTTAAFALVVFFSIQFLAIRKSGIKAYAHLFKPYAFMFPINLLEELARPIVLAMRLAFNILAGEILLFVVATLIVSNIVIGSVNISYLAAVAPIGIEFFNFAIGTIQAFVFTLLAIVYLALATADEH